MSRLTYALAAKIVIATQTNPDTANQAAYPLEVFMPTRLSTTAPERAGARPRARGGARPTAESSLQLGFRVPRDGTAIAFVVLDHHGVRPGAQVHLSRVGGGCLIAVAVDHLSAVHQHPDAVVTRRSEDRRVGEDCM